MASDRKCSICADGKSYRSQRNLDQHVLFKHGDGRPAELSANADVAELTRQVKALSDQVAAQAAQVAPQGPSGDIPSMDKVIAHCEGGACKVHADAWVDAKAKIVEAAYAAQTDQMIGDEARKRGLLPKSIIIKPLEPAKT